MRKVFSFLLALLMALAVVPLSALSVLASEPASQTAASDAWDAMSEKDKTDAYASLYAEGATGIFFAYNAQKDGTVTLNGNGGGTWQNLAGGDAATLIGATGSFVALDGKTYTKGWQASDNSIGYTTSWQTPGSNSLQMPSSLLGNGDTTLEMVASLDGLRAETGDKMGSLAGDGDAILWTNLIKGKNLQIQLLHRTPIDSIANGIHLAWFYNGYSDTGAKNNSELGQITSGLEGIRKQILSFTVTEAQKGDTVLVNWQFKSSPTTLVKELQAGGKESAAYTTGGETLILLENVPASVYAVRTYKRVLTDAERMQNHFVDIAFALHLDVDGIFDLTEKQRVSAMSALGEAFKNLDLNTVTKEVAQPLLDAVIAEYSLADDYEEYALLYAQNGLKALLFAYHGDDVTVKLDGNGGGTWKSRTEDGAVYALIGNNNGAYTAGGVNYTTGWNTVSGGGIGYSLSYDYLNNGGTGHYIDLSSQITNAQYDDDYTIEMIMSPRGLQAINAQSGDERWEYGIVQAPNYHIYTRHSYQGITTLPANQTMPLDNIYLGYSNNGTYGGGWLAQYINPALTAGKLYTLSVTQSIDGNNATVTTYMGGYTGADPERTFTTEAQNASGNNFRALNNVPATVYSLRFYDRVLTESEKLQNHFADLAVANRLEFDIEAFLSLPALAQSIVYEAMKDYEIFGEDQTTLQSALDAAYIEASHAADAGGLVSFDGISARLEGENGFRTLWAVDLAKLAELETMYDVRYGALLGVGNYYGIDYIDLKALTVKYDESGKAISEVGNSSAVLVYDTNSENQNASYLFVRYDEEKQTATYSFAVMYGDKGTTDMVDPAKYKTKYVCRAFVTLTDKNTGETATIYVDGINQSFTENERVSLEEVAAELLAKGYADNANLKAIAERAKEFVEYKDMTVYEYFGKWIDPNTCPMNFELVSSTLIPSPKAGVPDVVYNTILVDLGIQNTKFALSYAYPLVDEPATLPAIMMIHGASQSFYNYTSSVVYAAQCGYVAMAHDQPAITNSDPAMSGTVGDFRDTDRYMTINNPMACVMTSTVAAGLTAFHMLQSGAGLLDANGNAYTNITVDTENIGITGISWGGWATSMMGVLLGDQVKAIAAKFLCGNNTLNWFAPELNKLSPEISATWQKFFDPGMYAANLKAAFLMEEASKDTFGTPASINKFLTEAMTGDSAGIYLTIIPNENHKHSNTTLTNGVHYGILGASGYLSPNTTSLPSGVISTNAKELLMINNELAFFEYYLKGNGYAPSLVLVDHSTTAKQGDGSLKVTFTVETAEENPVADGIKLFYSPSGDAWNAEAKLWSFVTASVVSQDINAETGLNVYTYTATIPASAASQNLEFFAYYENAELGITNCSNMYSYTAANGSFILTGGYTMP